MAPGKRSASAPRRLRRGVAARAQKIQSDVVKPGRTGSEVDHEFNAGHPGAQRAPAGARGQQQADRIAQAQRGGVNERAEFRIALRAHDHLHAQRHHQRRTGFVGQRGDARCRAGSVERIDPAAQDVDRGHDGQVER